MRKLSVFAVLAALVAAPAALAKERNITMTAADVAPKAGQPWTATLRVAIDGTPGPAEPSMSPRGRPRRRGSTSPGSSSRPPARGG